METLRQDFAVLRCVDWNSDSFIKNVKFAFPVGIRELLAVDVNAAVELGNVFESFFLEKGSCCFTTDSTSAVGDNFFVFVLAEFLVHDFRKLFEVLHRQGDGVFEAADLGFVVVAHVDNHEVFVVFIKLVQLFWFNIFSAVLVWVQCFRIFHGYQFFAVTNEDFFKCRFTRACFEFGCSKKRIRMHCCDIFVSDLFWSANCTVDAVVCNEDSAFYSDLFAEFKMVVGEFFWIWNGDVFIIEENRPHRFFSKNSRIVLKIGFLAMVYRFLRVVRRKKQASEAA